MAKTFRRMLVQLQATLDDLALVRLQLHEFVQESQADEGLR